MRAPQKIYFSEVSPLYKFKPTPYKLRKSTGHALRDWLARMLWRGLENLGVLEPHMERLTTWTYTASHERDLVKAIYKHLDHMHLRYEDVDKFFLLVGAETFSEILRSEALRSELFLLAPLKGNTKEGRFLLGLPVVVAPYVTGMALVPKSVLSRLA